MKILISLLFSFQFANAMETSNAEWSSELRFLPIASNDLVEFLPVEDNKEEKREAKMEILSSSEDVNIDQLQMIERKSFDNLNYLIIIDGAAIALTVSHLEFDSCGTKVIKANTMNKSERIEMFLVDHTNRHCKDFVEHLWQADILSEAVSGASQLILVGNPQ